MDMEEEEVCESSLSAKDNEGAEEGEGEVNNGNNNAEDNAVVVPIVNEVVDVDLSANADADANANVTANDSEAAAAALPGMPPPANNQSFRRSPRMNANAVAGVVVGAVAPSPTAGGSGAAAASGRIHKRPTPRRRLTRHSSSGGSSFLNTSSTSYSTAGSDVSVRGRVRAGRGLPPVLVQDVKLCCSKAAFKRIIHETLEAHTQDDRTGRGGPQRYKIQGQALDVLQDAAEGYLGTLFRMCGLLSKHARRKGITVGDLQLAQELHDLVSGLINLKVY